MDKREVERGTNCAWKVARNGVTAAFIEFESVGIDAIKCTEEGIGMIGGLVDIDRAFGVEEEGCVCVEFVGID